MYTNCPLSSMEELMALKQQAEGTDDDFHIHACQQIWYKPLVDGSVAAVFVNWDTVPVNLTCTAACITEMGLTGGLVSGEVVH